ncbi:unnamed protein product [Nezara viridula]|uniref:Uncharacterized protein n=1 Tax=Nezara viridula TaxID=85310 RepID=A0A9P0HUK4_NEZVI|nr:unnamed protein product [Nezara viridula]
MGTSILCGYPQGGGTTPRLGAPSSRAATSTPCGCPTAVETRHLSYSCTSWTRLVPSGPLRFKTLPNLFTEDRKETTIAGELAALTNCLLIEIQIIDIFSHSIINKYITKIKLTIFILEHFLFYSDIWSLANCIIMNGQFFC